MHRFVIRQNIARYVELLKRSDVDARRRRTLERLLEEERAKLTDAVDAPGAEPLPGYLR
jgi:hypothetical protein